jgi:hypothetical protein
VSPRRDCSLYDYFPAASDWSTTTSRWTQRHYENLPASAMNDYIEQPIMNDGNGTAGASGTGPSAGYTFVFLFFFTRFLAGLAGNKKEYIYIITILLLYSWIKFNNNLPNFLKEVSLHLSSFLFVITI